MMFHFIIQFYLKMADSEGSLTDMMDRLDLGDVHDTGYEKNFDSEIIDGFYYHVIAFMNDKVRLFADFWMKLYSTCCLQRDRAVEFINKGRPDEAKKFLIDWPETYGSPQIPQLLFEPPQEPKRKKPSTLSIECDCVMLIKEMESNFIRGEVVDFTVPINRPETISLVDYETRIQECDNCFKTIENYVIQNAFLYGMWLSRAFDKFQEEKGVKRVSGNIDNWVDSRCRVKKTRAWQIRMFYKLFNPYKRVLRCKLPFIWFAKNGKAIVDYFKSHHEVAQPWTHELNCACSTCDFATSVA